MPVETSAIRAARTTITLTTIMDIILQGHSENTEAKVNIKQYILIWDNMWIWHVV